MNINRRLKLIFYIAKFPAQTWENMANSQIRMVLFIAIVITATVTCTLSVFSSITEFFARQKDNTERGNLQVYPTDASVMMKIMENPQPLTVINFMMLFKIVWESCVTRSIDWFL